MGWHSTKDALFRTHAGTLTDSRTHSQAGWNRTTDEVCRTKVPFDHCDLSSFTLEVARKIYRASMEVKFYRASMDVRCAAFHGGKM